MAVYGAEPVLRRGRFVFPALFQALAIAFPCIAWASIALAQASLDLGPSLGIESVHPDANSTVAFDIKPLGNVSHKIVQNVEMRDPSYRAEIDRSSMKTDPVTRRFSFDLYLNHTSRFA